MENNTETPVKEVSPNFKYKSEYAKRLYNWILGGGSFESFNCGVTRKTKQNWYNTIPEFAEARHTAEDDLQGNIDRVLYARAMGVTQVKIDGMDEKKQSEKVLMFLAKHRFRRTYADKSEVAVSNPDGTSIGAPPDLDNLTDEQLEQWIKLSEAIKK